jgi:hypothetical protein
MKIDETTKIASIVSIVVGVILSIAGYFANSKRQAIQENTGKLDILAKSLDVNQKTDSLTAKLNFEFSLLLARSFAIKYSESISGRDQLSRKISFPSSNLTAEFTKVYSNWGQRKGLMTGKACEKEGLMVRQVVTLIIQNIGQVDAVNILIKAKEKASPRSDPNIDWQESSSNGNALAYYDLSSATNGWQTRDFQIKDLRGGKPPEKDGEQEQVVLASVSGSSSLFGTVLVPIEVSWTDNVTKARQIKKIQVGNLMADLMGAEIGSLGSACR